MGFYFVRVTRDKPKLAQTVDVECRMGMTSSIWDWFGIPQFSKNSLLFDRYVTWDLKYTQAMTKEDAAKEEANPPPPGWDGIQQATWSPTPKESKYGVGK